MQKIAKSNSKQFWKEIKKFIKRKGQTSDDLSADDFFEHFSSVFQAHPTENNPENTQVGENADFILDNPITEGNNYFGLPMKPSTNREDNGI